MSFRILFLGPEDSPLRKWISEREDLISRTDRITPEFVQENGIRFVVSYGYRHIIKSDLLQLLPGAVINLHISLLPFNRGADPNFWSFIDDSPKGVTIHEVDTGLDTGPILLQQEVEFRSGNETLASSYAKLHEVIQNLFIHNWDALKSGRIEPVEQIGAGSYHSLKDKEELLHLLEPDGWDTNISSLVKRNKDESS